MSINIRYIDTIHTSDNNVRSDPPRSAGTTALTSQLVQTTNPLHAYPFSGSCNCAWQTVESWIYKKNMFY